MILKSCLFYTRLKWGTKSGNCIYVKICRLSSWDKLLWLAIEWHQFWTSYQELIHVLCELWRSHWHTLPKVILDIDVGCWIIESYDDQWYWSHVCFIQGYNGGPKCGNHIYVKFFWLSWWDKQLWLAIEWHQFWTSYQDLIHVHYTIKSILLTAFLDSMALHGFSHQEAWHVVFNFKQDLELIDLYKHTAKMFLQVTSLKMTR